MSKIELTREKYRELVKDSRFLAALEAAGVDNWDGHGIAREQMTKEEEFDDRLESVFSDIIDILSEGIDEPAGTGAGYSLGSEQCELAEDKFRKFAFEVRDE